MQDNETVVPPPEPTRISLPDERNSITNHFEIISGATIGDMTVPMKTDGYITPCDSAPWLCEPGHNDENLARENNVDAWICPGLKGESE